MDSFAQELIDTIIDLVPREDMRSCSLVAKRWTQRSQRHHFDFVILNNEYETPLWEANIPEVPYGIPSYVHRVRVGYILSWKEPAIFGRILKTFGSLESLAMEGTDIEPLGGLLDPASSGKLGRS